MLMMRMRDHLAHELVDRDFRESTIRRKGKKARRRLANGTSEVVFVLCESARGGRLATRAVVPQSEIMCVLSDLRSKAPSADRILLV